MGTNRSLDAEHGHRSEGLGFLTVGSMGQEHHGREQAAGCSFDRSSKDDKNDGQIIARHMAEERKVWTESVRWHRMFKSMCMGKQMPHTAVSQFGGFYAVDEAGEGGCGGFLSFSDR